MITAYHGQQILASVVGNKITMKKPRLQRVNLTRWTNGNSRAAK